MFDPYAAYRGTPNRVATERRIGVPDRFTRPGSEGPAEEDLNRSLAWRAIFSCAHRYHPDQRHLPQRTVKSAPTRQADQEEQK